MKELVIKKCLKCGALVEVLEDCTCDNCGIKCCGEEMKKLEPNTVDAAKEKHIPQYEIADNQIIVKVDHEMKEDHFIEWLALSANNKIGKKFLLPNNNPVAIFPYAEGSIIYAYCSKHGLWSNKVTKEENR